jgi:hypothetical protein
LLPKFRLLEPEDSTLSAKLQAQILLRQVRRGVNLLSKADQNTVDFKLAFARFCCILRLPEERCDKIIGAKPILFCQAWDYTRNRAHVTFFN